MDDLVGLFEWILSRMLGKLLLPGLLALPVIALLGWLGYFLAGPGTIDHYQTT